MTLNNQTPPPPYYLPTFSSPTLLGNIILCFTILNWSYTIAIANLFLILAPQESIPICLTLGSRLLLCFKKEKIEKFLTLVRQILDQSLAEVFTRKKLAGKCIAFSLAVLDGVCLFTNEINLAISRGLPCSRTFQITAPLCAEIRNGSF